LTPAGEARIFVLEDRPGGERPTTKGRKEERTMMKNAAWIPAMALAFLAVAGVARSDTTILTKTNDATQSLQVAPHRLHIGTADRGMIFRGDKKVLWIIDAAKKSYTEMTEADMKEMAAKLQDAREQMKNLPPGIAEKIQGALPGANLPKRIVTPLGLNKEINGFPCSGYTVATEGKRSTSEVWSTEPSAMKLGPEEMVVFKEFAEFMATAVPGLEEMADWAKDLEHPKEDQVPGIPVLTIVKDDEGKETLRTELLSVENQPIDPKVFEAPAGYEKNSMKMGK
jgi:hypothetical protein